MKKVFSILYFILVVMLSIPLLILFFSGLFISLLIGSILFPINKLLEKIKNNN